MSRIPHSRGAPVLAAQYARRMRSLRVQSARVADGAVVPHDRESRLITLNLPPPMSANERRSRATPAYIKAYRSWVSTCDGYVYADGGRRRLGMITGPYEAKITLDRDYNRMDIDNAVKCLLDYVVRLELIPDDGPKWLQRLVVEFGEAPRGCRVVLHALDGTRS